VAVFIDGCFWHGCPQHATTPRANRAWWVDKLAANRRRDRDTDKRLTEAGWTILRFWEHEEPIEVANRIRARVLSKRK
jgi:DNA mismatch endonuclease (patch repair protein)